MHAYLYLALFWAVFYFLHTYLANLEFKIWLRTNCGLLISITD
jgi:hypothetical protein